MRWRAYYIVFAITCLSVAAQAQYASRLGRFFVDNVKGCAPLTVTITINPASDCCGSPCACNAGSPCDMFFGDTTQGNLTFSHTYTQPGSYSLSILFGACGFDDIPIIVAPNTPPQFDLYSCSNNEVQANITDTSYDQYFIDFNDGPEVGPVLSGTRVDHLYATPGLKNVSVRGRNLNPIPPGGIAADNCTPATKSITALASLAVPAISQLRVIDNATIQLDFNAQQNILYRLDIATNSGTTFQLYKTIYNATSETVGNLRPEDNYYCFRLGVVDPCNNNATTYSPVICSSNFDLNIQNNSNDLTWATSAAGISNFRLTRETQGSTLTTTVTGSAYSDTNISCGVNYCYQLVTNYPNGSQSISLQKCGTAQSTDIPDAVENVTVSTLQANEADVSWPQVINFTPAEFTLFKSINGQYNQLGTTTNLQFTDSGYRIEHESCYQVSYKDVCDNQSPRSAEACPVVLTGSLQKDNVVNLSWSHYVGWRNGVSEYIVEKYSESGTLLQIFSAGSAVSFSDDSQDLNNQIYFYVVRANASEAGLPQAVSNRIMIIKNPNIFYPTAFTPNGDNLNDNFNVFGQYIDSFEMNIFNRWGELLYTTTALDQGWDGNFRGNPMPEGTYTFIAVITDKAGRTLTKSGSVLLLKKTK